MTKSSPESDTLSYQIITTNQALTAWCQMAATHSALALDIEFIRVRTYYPQPGLIQMCVAGQIALVDPLPITDWEAFRRLLRQQGIRKFLHAGGEDLEVLQHSFQVQPVPFIDTQVLAAFTGHPLSVGLASLVAQYAGITLDKSEVRTDWLARPLTERQCAYASADVAWLLPVADKLMAQAATAGWLDAVDDECLLIQQRRTQPAQPQNAWRDISNHWALRPRQLACLQQLAAWRLLQAQQQDLAINFLLRAERLWQLARYLPGSMAELSGLGLSGREIRLYGETLLALVAQAQTLPEQALPVATINPGHNLAFRRATQVIKALVEQTARDCGLPAGLLASRRQIIQLLNWHWKVNGYERESDALPAPLPELLSGWRGKLLAQPVNALLTNCH